jgi:hypothetical protein
MRASRNPLRASVAVRRSASFAFRGCFIATLLFGFAVFAQDETPPETPSLDEAVESAPDEDLDPEIFDSNSLPSLDIEEIIITGEQGGMLVKDDTVSVMSFDAGELQVEGIKDIRDLSNFTPSLEIKSAFAASNPTIYIRGVGLDDFNANAASAVAVYQDGVYMQSPAGQLFQFYDVENVEVLRGPQGTLYRNASAGAILLRSRKPEDEFSSSVTATYGNFELWEVEGFVNAPIIPDILSGRLSGTWAIRDGITKNRCAAQADQAEVIPPPPGRPVKPPCNQTTGGAPGVPQVRFVDPHLDDDTNDVDYFAVRGQLLLNAPIWETETEWLLNVHGGQNNSRAFQYQHTGVKIDPKSEEPSNIGGPDAGGYQDNDGDPFAGDYNIDGPEDIDLWGANLQTTVLLTTSSAWRIPTAAPGSTWRPRTPTPPGSSATSSNSGAPFESRNSVTVTGRSVPSTSRRTSTSPTSSTRQATSISSRNTPRRCGTSPSTGNSSTESSPDARAFPATSRCSRACATTGSTRASTPTSSVSPPRGKI